MSVFSNPSGAAPEHAGTYIRALLDLLGDRDPRGVLGATAEGLRAATGALSADRLRRPEAPGKWSAVQVIQHLADAELIWAWRARLVIAHDKPTITPYDQDLWAERLRYDSITLQEALEQFEFMRRMNLQLVDHLTAAEKQRTGWHPERGEESIERMMRLAAAHDLVHLRQIQRILEDK